MEPVCSFTTCPEEAPVSEATLFGTPSMMVASPTCHRPRAKESNGRMMMAL